MTLVKRCLLTLIALMVFCMSSAALANSGKLTEDEAWEKAFALVEQQTGYSKDQLKKNQILDGDDIWYVTIVLKKPLEDEDGLYYVEMDNDGKLISLILPSKIFLESQLERDIQACFYCEDSYLLLAEATAKWKKKLSEISEPVISDEWTWERYLKVINLGIVAPPDNVLSYPEARQAALKQLAGAEGWTDDMPELFNIWVSAYYTLDETPVWFFGLRTHSYSEKEYETDAAMEKYKQKLDTAFGKVNQVAPAEIGILINAKTGELVEKPMLDYIPVKFLRMDFLIRTDEAVASITGDNP